MINQEEHRLLVIKLNLNLCNYVAYIHVQGTIAAPNTRTVAVPNDNCAPSFNCISEVNKA